MLKAWMIVDENDFDEPALIILERSRGQALQRWAHEHELFFHEVIERGSRVRVRRAPLADGFGEYPTELYETGLYLLYNCWVECHGYRCWREITRSPDDHVYESEQAIILGWEGYCVDCAAAEYGVEIAAEAMEVGGDGTDT